MQYTKLYTTIKKSASMDVYTKLILSELIALGNNGATISPSYKLLSEQLAISERKIKYSISNLKTLGYIEVKDTPRNNIYILNKEKLDADFGIYSNENKEKAQRDVDESDDFLYNKKKRDFEELIKRRKR